mmetsp:Transcript_12056/g.39666  ORF Transcript_12056/g.39666 Transcript_12056/m.39666 type:complete len:354 (-) Transcript_12056:393-1454(-)
MASTNSSIYTGCVRVCECARVHTCMCDIPSLLHLRADAVALAGRLHRKHVVRSALALHIRREGERAEHALNVAHARADNLLQHPRRLGAEPSGVGEHVPQQRDAVAHLLHVVAPRGGLGLVQHQHGGVERQPVRLQLALAVPQKLHAAAVVQQPQRTELLQQHGVADHRLGRLQLDALGCESDSSRKRWVPVASACACAVRAFSRVLIARTYCLSALLRSHIFDPPSHLSKRAWEASSMSTVSSWSPTSTRKVSCAEASSAPSLRLRRRSRRSRSSFCRSWRFSSRSWRSFSRKRSSFCRSAASRSSPAWRACSTCSSTRSTCASTRFTCGSSSSSACCTRSSSPSAPTEPCP